MMPQTPSEVILWILLSLTAGFCEVYRGYLQRQFSALTHSFVGGIGLQAIAFVSAFAPSKVKKAVAIVYFILVLAVAALMVWKRAQQAPQARHDQQIRQRNELALQKLEHEHAYPAPCRRVRSEAWR